MKMLDRAIMLWPCPTSISSSVPLFARSCREYRHGTVSYYYLRKTRLYYYPWPRSHLRDDEPHRPKPSTILCSSSDLFVVVRHQSITIWHRTVLQRSPGWEPIELLCQRLWGKNSMLLWLTTSASVRLPWRCRNKATYVECWATGWEVQMSKDIVDADARHSPLVEHLQTAVQMVESRTKVCLSDKNAFTKALHLANRSLHQ